MWITPSQPGEMQMVQAYMQTLQQRLMEEQQLAMQAQQFAALQAGGGGWCSRGRAATARARNSSGLGRYRTRWVGTTERWRASGQQ